ncbi:MAG: RpiB/LacA/LacB family sugar-phosphate isomerase, partial [Rothia dentocariosa]
MSPNFTLLDQLYTQERLLNSGYTRTTMRRKLRTKELSALARAHNNANVLSIPARFTAIEQAVDIANTFLNTPFEGGRHER